MLDKVTSIFHNYFSLLMLLRVYISDINRNNLVVLSSILTNIILQNTKCFSWGISQLELADYSFKL